jgi:hypothetical protein
MATSWRHQSQPHRACVCWILWPLGVRGRP